MNESSKRVLLVNSAYALSAFILFASALLTRFAYSMVPGLAESSGEMLAGEPAYGPLFSVSLAVSEFITVALPALLLLCFRPVRQMMRESFWRRFNPSILLIVPLAFCSFFAVTGLTLLWISFLGALGLSVPETGVPIPSGAADLFLGVLVVGLFPALCEEFLFRGLMQGAYKAGRPFLAIAVTGCLFALLHGQLVALPGHLLLGILLCLSVYFTRSIWAGVLFHIIHNSMALGVSMASQKLNELADGALDGFETAAAAPGSLQPILSGIGFFVFFGGITAAFFVALYFAGRHFLSGEKGLALPDEGGPAAPAPAESPASERLSPIAFLPLLPAGLIVIVNYLFSIFDAMGRPLL
ncbi:MAG: CPBP family intramembrane metalloprotease [Christensenellaceae bacterium]|jgi:membrane protease YdiL (CAAX protease family)|nr:CPBP family intramembrane metalloprotease [Christensenellaceae bacterium]